MLMHLLTALVNGAASLSQRDKVHIDLEHLKNMLKINGHKRYTTH